MDYASFRQFRDDLLKSRRPGRLDCMNPVRALGPMVGPRPTGDATVAEAVSTWSKATGIDLPDGAFAVGTGIRDLLAATIRSLPPGTRELWLPEDVYPVYWETARAASVSPKAFPTLPAPDWSFLARTGKQAVVLIPYPLSPTGRIPTASEATDLVSWLSDSKERLLILDAVYTYDFAAVRESHDPLMATGACVSLWSCSKSWLQPSVLGVARAPKAIAAMIPRYTTLPSTATLGIARSAIKHQPDLPLYQQRSFDREWRRLAPAIRSACPGWQPPQSGYFSVLQAPFRHLLETHNLLVVPASVFGSPREGISVATCLHDLILNERLESK